MRIYCSKYSSFYFVVIYIVRWRYFALNRPVYFVNSALAHTDERNTFHHIYLLFFTLLYFVNSYVTVFVGFPFKLLVMFILNWYSVCWFLAPIILWQIGWAIYDLVAKCREMWINDVNYKRCCWSMNYSLLFHTMTPLKIQFIIIQ